MTFYEVFHDFNQTVYKLMKTHSGIDVQIIDLPMIESLAGMSDRGRASKTVHACFVSLMATSPVEDVRSQPVILWQKRVEKIV